MRKKSKLFANSTPGTLIPHINPIFSSKHSGLGRRAVHWCKTCRPLSLVNSDPHGTPAEGHSCYAHCANWKTKCPETADFLCPPLGTGVTQHGPLTVPVQGRSSLISHNHIVPGDKQMTFVLLGKSMWGRKKEGTEANVHGKLPLTLWRKGKQRIKGHCSIRVTLNRFWGEEGDQGLNTALALLSPLPLRWSSPCKPSPQSFLFFLGSPLSTKAPPHPLPPHDPLTAPSFLTRYPRPGSRSPSPWRCLLGVPHHAASPLPTPEPWPGLSVPSPRPGPSPHRFPCGGGCAQRRRPGCGWAARAGRWRRRAPSAGPRSPTSRWRRRLCPVPIPIPI